MGYIYKIINNINNKIYIGQTSRSIESRWKEHIIDSQNPDKQTYLYKAFNKYGIENFSIEEIIEAPQSELDELEIYYIKQYDSYNNGYNMTLGGSSHRIYNADEIYKLWDEGKPRSEIMQITGISPHQFWELIKAKSNYSKEESAKRGSKGNSKPVIQYDLTGQYIQTYSSIQEAARQTMSIATNIVKVLKGKMKQTNGFIWKYK